MEPFARFLGLEKPLGKSQFSMGVKEGGETKN